MQASAAELEAAGFAESVGGDWRLPNSPEMALQLAQEDLAERLAHLYAEKVSLNLQTWQNPSMNLSVYEVINAFRCGQVSAGVMARTAKPKVSKRLIRDLLTLEVKLEARNALLNAPRIGAVSSNLDNDLRVASRNCLDGNEMWRKGCGVSIGHS